MTKADLEVRTRVGFKSETRKLRDSLVRDAQV